MHVNLKCRCGLKIPVTKEQANGTVQCRSCLNKIHVPNEKALVDLAALSRDVRLRTIGFLIMAALAVAAIAAGAFTASTHENLGKLGRDARNAEVEENHKNNLTDKIAELKAKNPKSVEIGSLEDAKQRLGEMPSDEQEIKGRINEMRDIINSSIAEEYRAPQTKKFLATADMADKVQVLLYGFVIAAGVGLLLIIVISTRISTHKHRLLNYEKTTHTKVISA